MQRNDGSDNAHPVPEPQPKKRRLSKGKLVALVIALVVLVPILAIAAILGISYLGYLSDAQPQRIDTSQTQAVPADPDAFLDNRYAEGARTLSLEAASVRAKGYTSDRERLVVWTMPEGLGTVVSQNIVQLYDVASGQVVSELENLSECSRVTPTDTIFCTQQTSSGPLGLVAADERRLVEIDLVSGDMLREVTLDPIGTGSLEYLGESNGMALLELESTNGFGHPSFWSLHALPESGDAFAWSMALDETKEVFDQCIFAEESSRIACTVRQYGATADPGATDDSGGPSFDKVKTFDAATGEVVSDIDSASFPTLASDGWINIPWGSSDGVSRDETASYLSTMQVFDYDGIDITDRYAEQIANDVGMVNLVPVPNKIGSEPQVTYPLDAHLQGTNLATIVLDSAGTVVLESDRGLLDRPNHDGPTMKRVDGGQEISTGTPLGVTANGAVVLNQTSHLERTGALVDTATGESIMEIVPGGTLASLSVEFGTVVYSESDTSTVVLLPGA